MAAFSPQPPDADARIAPDEVPPDLIDPRRSIGNIDAALFHLLVERALIR